MRRMWRKYIESPQFWDLCSGDEGGKWFMDSIGSRSSNSPIRNGNSKGWWKWHEKGHLGIVGRRHMRTSMLMLFSVPRCSHVEFIGSISSFPQLQTTRLLRAGKCIFHYFCTREYLSIFDLSLIYSGTEIKWTHLINYIQLEINKSYYYQRR